MSTTPTPPNGMVSNTELILRKILGEDVTPLPPNSRVEFYLLLVKDLIAQLQSAVNLRGETTTPLTDNATTNPIMIDGKSYTAVMNDAVIYQSGEFIFDGTKWHELGDLSNLTSLNIGAMTGYSKPSETSAIVVADTLNAAIGKLEKALDLKQSTIDSDHKLSADNVDDSNTTNKFATAAELEQIETNKNNILSIHKEADLYFSETEPTDSSITAGSYWISTTATKIYHKSTNLSTGVARSYYLNNDATIAGRGDYNSGLVIAVNNNSNYTISTTESQARYRIACIDSELELNEITTAYTGTNRDNTSDIITINTGTHNYIVINATDLTKIMCNEGSTALPYEAYYAPYWG